MQTTIYIDILFLLNIIIDFIIIATTAFFTGRECNITRVLFASALGALYSTLIFFPQTTIINISILKILISLIMVAIAFRFSSPSTYFKTAAIYYIINFLYGGGIYVFYRFTALGSKMNYSNGEYYIDMPLWLILMVTVIFYFTVKFLSTSINKISTKNEKIKITIVLNNNSVTLTAIIDSGNALYDPISSLPVMVVQSDALKNLFDSTMLSLSKNEDSIYKALKKYKLRIIPFSNAAGKKDTLYAFKPTKILLTESGEELNQMLVGITNHILSKNSDYCALLHSKTFSRR